MKECKANEEFCAGSTVPLFSFSGRSAGVENWSLNPKKKTEELAGDLSLSGVAGATSFSFRPRFFVAARSALELYISF